MRTTYNLITSSWLFFGRISSMCDVRSGYVSSTRARMARWAEDFSLDFAPGASLGNCRQHSCRGKWPASTGRNHMTDSFLNMARGSTSDLQWRVYRPSDCNNG